MRRIKRVDTTRFSAQDQRGQGYTLYRERPMLDMGTHQNPHAERPGLERYRTADGRAVNWIARGRYEIVGHPNIEVTSDDPQAP